MAHILAQLAKDPAGVLRALGGVSKREHKRAIDAVTKRVKALEDAAPAYSLGAEDLPDEEPAKALMAEAAAADAALEDQRLLTDAGPSEADLLGLSATFEADLTGGGTLADLVNDQGKEPR